MSDSISKTFEKINTELKGSAFLSIILTISILSFFFLYKIALGESAIKNDSFLYEKSDVSESGSIKIGDIHFIYASKRGKKYYYYNCKSSIKEENKIYFQNESSAERAGYTLSKSCK